MKIVIWIITLISIFRYNKINLQVFYEALCPPSLNAISLLTKTINILGGFDVVGHVNFIPFGFEIIKDDRMLKCQHGPEECYGNKLHACANKYLPLTIANNFISCTILNVTEYVNKRLAIYYGQVQDLCFLKNKISLALKNEIINCASGIEIEKYMINNYHLQFVANKVKTTPHFILNGLDNKVVNLVVAHKPLVILCDFLKLENIKFCNLMKKVQPQQPVNINQNKMVKNNIKPNNVILPANKIINNKTDSKEGCSGTTKNK